MRILDPVEPNEIRLSWDNDNENADITSYNVGMDSIKDIVERMRGYFGTYLVDECAMLHRSETCIDFRSGVEEISFTVNGNVHGKYYTIIGLVEGGA